MSDAFPNAGATVYYNEAGEVLGWDNDLPYEPEYCDMCGYHHPGPCPSDEWPDEPDGDWDEDDEDEASE